MGALGPVLSLLVKIGVFALIVFLLVRRRTRRGMFCSDCGKPRAANQLTRESDPERYCPGDHS